MWVELLDEYGLNVGVGYNLVVECDGIFGYGGYFEVIYVGWGRSGKNDGIEVGKCLLWWCICSFYGKDVVGKCL